MFRGRSIPHSWELLPMLGLRRGQHLPADGLGIHNINGVKVWIDSIYHMRHSWKGRKPTRAHRVMCECPECGWTGSAGRLFQHTCKKEKMNG